MKKAIFLLTFLTLISLTNVSAITETITLDDYLLDISYDENDVNSGETFRIEVTVKNEAGETRNGVNLEIEVNDPLDVAGDSEEDIGTLEDNEEETIIFRIEIDEDASKGDEEIEFTLTDSSGVDDSDDFLIDIKNDNPNLIIGEKNSFPSLISADLEDVELVLTIENIGEGDAEFTLATLELPKEIVSSGSFGLTSNLGTIASGNSKEVSFFIDTLKDLEDGNHQATLVLEYEDEEGDRKTQRINFDIPIKGKALFEVTSSTFNPVKLTPGSSGTLYVTITNLGSDKGEETTIRVFEHSDIPLSFDQKTGLIGDLNPGQSSQASISFDIDGDATPKKYLLRAQTRTITNGVVSTEDFTIPFTIEESEPKSPMFYLAVLVGILFVMVLIFAWKR